MAVRGMAQLRREIAKFKVDVTTEPGQLVRRIVLDIADGTIFGTPVDTGRLRGGWFVSIGGPSNQETGRVDAGGGATMAAVAGALAVLPKFPTVSFGNNVEYAVPVEFGHSDQAPQGMLRLNVERVRARFGD